MLFASLTFPAESGQRQFLLDRETTTIGRLVGQDVLLEDQCVSRRHAVIVREGGRYSVVDQDSSQGTFLNGVRIQRSVLTAGDILQFGSFQAPQVRFLFESARPAEESPSITADTQFFSSIREFPHLNENQPQAAREMEQLTWLLSAARQLNAGGAIEDILTTLLKLTLQLTGVHRGFVFLREGEQMKLARGLNAQGQLIDEDLTISHGAIRKAVESDAKYSISDTLTDDSTANRASVVVNNIRSIYCIPLRKRDARGHNAELLGLLYLDSQISAGELNEVDHQLLDTVSTEAAALLHNALLAEAEYKARRASEELAVAAEIHSGLMSISMPVVPYAVLKARSVPCHEIGGDFFDALRFEDCVCVTIADVSGKGLPAAIVAATMQGIIHAQLRSGQSFPAIATLLNEFLCTRKVGKYATMVLLKVYADGRLEYVNCGHVPPLIIHEKGVTRLEEGNLIVGLLPFATYASAEFRLHPGDRLLLVTDGLVEAENFEGESFGEPRLSEAARQFDINGILKQVSLFHAPNEAQDDCTLVEVQFLGAKPAEEVVATEPSTVTAMN